LADESVLGEWRFFSFSSSPRNSGPSPTRREWLTACWLPRESPLPPRMNPSPDRPALSHPLRDQPFFFLCALVFSPILPAAMPTISGYPTPPMIADRVLPFFLLRVSASRCASVIPALFPIGFYVFFLFTFFHWGCRAYPLPLWPPPPPIFANRPLGNGRRTFLFFGGEAFSLLYSEAVPLCVAYFRVLHKTSDRAIPRRPAEFSRTPLFFSSFQEGILPHSYSRSKTPLLFWACRRSVRCLRLSFQHAGIAFFPFFPRDNPRLSFIVSRILPQPHHFRSGARLRVPFFCRCFGIPSPVPTC